MSDPDPFEDFLEDALGAPDFELGHDIRRRLLAAAVAGDAAEACDNVVRMDRPDPDAAAGFAWIVGEAPASTALMSRMVADNAFLEMLDSERCFLRTLRAALRRGAAAAVAPPARRSWTPAVAISAAAALAMAAGAIFWSPAKQPAAAVASVTPAATEKAPAGGAAHEEAPALVASAEERSDESVGSGGSDSSGGGASLPEAELAGLNLPPLPEPEGSGRSIELDDPLLAAITPLESALALAAKDEILPEPILAALGGGVDGTGSGGGMGGGASGSDGMLASLSGSPLGSSSMGGMSGMGGGVSTGTSLIGGTGPTGGDREGDGTIPEPGGALPVMIGFMILFLRRPVRKGK